MNPNDLYKNSLEGKKKAEEAIAKRLKIKIKEIDERMLEASQKGNFSYSHAMYPSEEFFHEISAHYREKGFAVEFKRDSDFNSYGLNIDWSKPNCNEEVPSKDSALKGLIYYLHDSKFNFYSRFNYNELGKVFTDFEEVNHSDKVKVLENLQDMFYNNKKSFKIEMHTSEESNAVRDFLEGAGYEVFVSRSNYEYDITTIRVVGFIADV